jgi:hypothetical protein
MKHLFTFVLTFASLSASAQERMPSAPPDSDLSEIAARLKDVMPLAPSAAEASLRSRADSGDDRARELLTALRARASAAALGDRLAPLDTDGALRYELRSISAALGAARRGAAVLADAEKAAAPRGEADANDDDNPGWSNEAAAFAGTTGASGRRLPASGLADEARHVKGPWKTTFDAEALFASDGKGTASQADLGAETTRELPFPRLRAFAGAELHHDDLLGIRHDASVTAGIEGDAYQSKRQTLTLGVGVGAGQEHHADGTSERHPILLTQFEYDLKLSAHAAFSQFIDFEQNPLEKGDYETSSMTSFVYRLSRTCSLRLVQDLSRRGQPVPGYAPQRSQTLLGLVFR